MGVRLSIDPRALAELQAAVVWYEGKAPGLGRSFLDEVDRAVALVAEFPESGSASSARQPEIRVRPLDRFPYSVAYLRREDEVVVLALAHQHRRPGYWRRRMRLHRRGS